MIQSHEENHEESAGTLAHSRAYVWVVKGRSLARKLARSCPRFRLEKCRMLQQKVGQLPEDRIEIGCLPFSYISLDLLGPVKVKGIVNKRSQMGCYPLLFVCQLTGAMHVKLMVDYSMAVFLVQWGGFTAL